jgi:Lysyl oxidase
MRLTRWNRQRCALTAAGLAIAALAVPGLPAPGAAGAAMAGPQLRLIAAQHSITLDSFNGQVYLDPGMWVAAFGSPLQLDVRRASYTKPITITQIIYPPSGGTVRRPLPASVINGFNYGLTRFLTLTARNSAGKVAATETIPFCPDTYDPERAGPSSPRTSPYPQQCPTDPFALSAVWGVQKGWATDPAETNFLGHQVKLAPGTYQVTGTITPEYTRLLHIPARDATTTVKVTVVKGPKCCPVPGCCLPGPAHGPRGRALPSLPAVRTTASPPPSALPDLVALPAWQIRVSHPRKQTHDFLDFGATVWIGGNGPLDVEGFRSHASPVMKAYQYFWHGGQVIGRARAGTMGFDGKQGHNHWHFEQFARYALVTQAKTVAVASHKMGFCIAPVDAVDLLAPHALWQPSFVGLQGACGSPTALWVTEELPVGWGDTYIQSIAGQNFDITGVPNGTYYIQVAANPEGVLHETTASNDVSFRKVILGGTPGHRTVKVPPWHGIDPEP